MCEIYTNILLPGSPAIGARVPEFTDKWNRTIWHRSPQVLIWGTSRPTPGSCPSRLMLLFSRLAIFLWNSTETAILYAACSSYPRLALLLVVLCVLLNTALVCMYDSRQQLQRCSWLCAAVHHGSQYTFLLSGAIHFWTKLVLPRLLQSSIGKSCCVAAAART